MTPLQGPTSADQRLRHASAVQARRGRQFALILICLLFGCWATPSPAIPDNLPPVDFPTGNDTMRIQRVDGDTQILDAKSKQVLIDHVLRPHRAGDELILVKTGGENASDDAEKAGLLSMDGRVVIKPMYDEIVLEPDSDAILVKNDDKYALFGLDGRQRTPFEYDDLNTLGSSADLWVAKRDDKDGVVDPHSGRVVVPLAYKNISIWHGFILAATGYHSNPDTRTTVFDGHGKLAAGLKDVHELDRWYDAGLLVADGRVVNPASGETIVEAGRYDRIKPFDGSKRDASLDYFDEIRPHKAIAIVEKNGQFGAIGADGALRVPIKYQRVAGMDAYKAGYLRVIADTPQAGHNVGVIDIHGNEVVPTEWDGIDLREVAERSGDPSQWYFFVRRDDRFGSLALDGSTIVPAEFDVVAPMTRGGALYRLERDGKSGLCNLLTGECPIDFAYDDISLFDDSTPHAEIFLVTKGEKHGLVTENGKTLIAPVEGIRAVETGPSDSGLKVTVTDGDGVHGQILTYDDDSKSWLQDADPVDAQALLDSGDYDGHGVAQLEKPTIIERYLPEQFADADAVLAGVNQGKLREPSYPSLQISADRKAYVFFSEFTDVSARIRNTLTVCPTRDGFDLLLNGAQDGTASCQDADQAAPLHFTRSDDGQSLHCEVCQSMGIPADWILRNNAVDTPAQCARDISWSQEQAEARYADWLKRWTHDIGALTKAMESGDHERSAAEIGRMIGSSVDMTSRAPYNIIQGLAATRPADNSGAPTIGALKQAFASAKPAGYGGIYPETSDQFADKCQQVWYLRLSKLERAVANGDKHPANLSYTLPDTGDFKRQAYPFVLFTVSDGTLRWAGLAAEFVDALNWHADRSEDDISPDAH